MEPAPALPKLITRRNLSIAWFLLYAIALALPAIVFNQVESKDPPDIWRGWEVLILGWLGLFYMQPAWLANFLILPILVCCWLRKWKACGILAAIAIALALTSFCCLGLYLPRDEGGIQHLRVAALGSGFYFWVISFAVCLAAFAHIGKRQVVVLSCAAAKELDN